MAAGNCLREFRNREFDPPPVDERDGLETAQQLQAVISALDKAKTVLVTDHIENHLEDVVGPRSREAREKLARLTDLAKYL
jgi:DNA-binding FrmR family transcriptional regulator